MDDAKALYFRIENPIDNKSKWNKILNIYSISSSYDDFCTNIKDLGEGAKDKKKYFDIEGKDSLMLMLWSIWKAKVLSYTEEELQRKIDDKEFNTDIYDVVGKVSTLPSIKYIAALKETLKDRKIAKYFSRMFKAKKDDIEIGSDFSIFYANEYDTVLTITVSAENLYKAIKFYINQCIRFEIPYLIKYNEEGRRIKLQIYTSIENTKKNESILNILKKENYSFVYENAMDVLDGNVNEFISIKNKELYDDKEYLLNRCRILYDSFNSVLYNYILNHLSTIVSYKDGRMNLTEYLASYVTEKVISMLLSNNIKTDLEYFFIANSDDLHNLRGYIKNKLLFNMSELLSQKLYLKGEKSQITLKLNENNSIDISVSAFMNGIRALTMTLIHKDASLEKLFRARIKNECHLYNVDSTKFCLDEEFTKELFYNKSLYDNCEKELTSIKGEITKLENLEILMNQKDSEEKREIIKASMKDLIGIFGE